MKKLIKRFLYPHRYSSQAYADYLRKRGVKVGKNLKVYNLSNTEIDVRNPLFLEIGDDVQIASNVKILAHDYSFSVMANALSDFSRKQGVTRIGNNVFIGINSVVLMGAEVGDNVIIGANSLVRGKLDSNSVYAGNPVKKICTLSEYRDKCRASFEQSARVYFERFKEAKGRYPAPDEMLIYMALFADKAQLREYVRAESYGDTISDSAKEKIDMSYLNKYSDVEEFMSKVT